VGNGDRQNVIAVPCRGPEHLTAGRLPSGVTCAVIVVRLENPHGDFAALAEHG
jgi:hypothetical protein